MYKAGSRIVFFIGFFVLLLINQSFTKPTWGLFLTTSSTTSSVISMYQSEDTTILNKKDSINCKSDFSEPELSDRDRAPCQPIITSIDTFQCIPIPYSDANGYLYFRQCQNDSVKITIKCQYPQNNTNYTQHDTLNTYHWLFGDGQTRVTDDPYTWYPYDSAKGYELSVFVKDSNNCVSLPIVCRVVVSGNPFQQIKNPPPLCVGDTTAITVASLTSYTPYSYSQVTSQRFDSTMFIPDGLNCNPTNPCYNTEVFFTSFLPNQTITSGNDIQSICVNMEHSYVGDMEFTLQCPNGQSTTLKKYINWGGADMGLPCQKDGDPHKCDSPLYCDPNTNTPGTGWNYCWSEIYPDDSTINYNAGKARLDSTHLVAKLHYYQPDSSFGKLIGCPLNGRWSIQICDKWKVDNGYIFNWSMELSPSLLPQAWGYSAGIDSTWITGPDIIATNGQTAYVSPSTTGTFSYNCYILDEFQCIWDSTLQVSSWNLPEVDLPDDTAVCANTPLILNAGPNTNSYQWNTGSTLPSISVNTSGLYTVVVTSQHGCITRKRVMVTINPRPGIKLIRHF